MSCGCGCSGEVVAYEEWDEEEDVTAAEYQGRTVTLNKPFRTSGGPKKFAVYTKNGSGTVVIVRFGDPNMEIKRDDPARRKAFRSRHNCQTPGPKWKARYWSCRQWRGGKKVEAEDGSPCGCGCNDDNVEAKDADDPCTSGYEQYGMKMKNGRKVPNCIPIKKSAEAKYEVCSSCMSQEKCANHGDCMSVAYIEDPEPSMEKALKQAAEPTPNDSETHDEYMSRCMAMNYTKEECMAAHEGHTFKDQDEAHDEEDHEAGYGMKKKKYAEECGYGEKMIDGKCRKVSVTLDLAISDMSMQVEASANGDSKIRIEGIAFHEGKNKNNWSLTKEGALATIEQMVGADVTLLHPKPNEHGAGFSRNMSGDVEEATVGYIESAELVELGEGKWNVRYVAYVVRDELFPSLEAGLWSREGYGVSIGGSGVPISAEENNIVFGTDFTFDHLAIVHKPAYQRANIEKVERIEKEEVKATLISHSESASVNKGMVRSMSEEENNTINEEMEALQAELVLANARVAEFEAEKIARAEEERTTFVAKATELGMSGHEELSQDTLVSLIASWEEAHPAPTPVEMTPVESVEKVEASVAASTESSPVVANYLNGKMISTDEQIYARAWNAWASAWNSTLGVEEKKSMAAPNYSQKKEMR
tara:strand:+ start:5475 stop:7412 length:1938 start_codon:yes stop_codon:yes gene_type:complete